jgi:hypothetical protein
MAARSDEPFEDPTTPSDPRRPTPSGRGAAPRGAFGRVLEPLAGALLGAFWGGMSGLRAVDPEDDPLG